MYKEVFKMAHFIGQLFSLVSNFFSADCGKRRGGANRVGDEVFCDPSAALAFSLRGAIAGHNRCSVVAGCGFWVLRGAFLLFAGSKPSFGGSKSSFGRSKLSFGGSKPKKCKALSFAFGRKFVSIALVRSF
ncbi:hypothetical protein [Alloprevotella tannerae]|uniref:hypothetical protein n=1 Tax=Alloprevotella tannerae TaxID=76122 RepID=UPI0028E4B71B|nr:hypothetical protein [Alloprevotella tannerae]